MNIGAQLSQEGSEGDINLMSAGIGALSGAMTAPGASDYFSMRAGLAGEGTGLMSQAQKFGFDTLAKGSDFLKTGGIDTAGGTTAKLLSTEGAKVATLPAATATGDVMQAEARRLEKQAAIDDALAAAEGMADNAGRALAIRNAMTSYGFFTDEEIENTIASAGQKAGCRVGFFAGGSGIPSLPIADQTREMEPEEFEGTVSELLMLENIDKPIIKKSYSKEDSGRRNEAFFEIIDPETGSMSTISQEDYFEQYGEPKAKGGRVGFRFGGIDEAVESVQEETVEKGKEGIMTAAKEDPLLVEEYNKYVFDLMEQRPDAKPMSFQDFKRMIKAGMKMGGRVKAEEGGLMDLDGKEMDLRGGGFVPIGKKEKADDVPARLSKNEFVMTADAVRAAGGGSVNEGAKRMYETMNKLEARA